MELTRKDIVRHMTTSTVTSNASLGEHETGSIAMMIVVEMILSSLVANQERLEK